MCEPGKPCNMPNAEANLAKAIEYMSNNREAISSQFERTFDSHPAIKSARVQAVMKDKPDGTAKLKALCEQFYLAGIMDLIVHGVDVIEPVQAEAEADPIEGLDKLGELIAALKAAQKHFSKPPKIHEIRDIDENDVSKLEIPEVPEGYQMDMAHLYNSKTGKTHTVDIRGLTPDEVRAKIDKVLKADV